MKVALISNMNNNYFALFRYWTNAGVDVTLFSFEDEYQHFNPSNDTWFWEEWEHKIQVLPFTYYNHYNTILTFDKESVKKKLESFDVLIGSGPTPAYLYTLGMYLDAFFPYKTGIEYYRDTLSWRNKELSKQIKDFNTLQKKALNKTKYALNCDFRNLTYQRILKLGMKNIPISIPMVYVEEKPDEIELPILYNQCINKMNDSDFVLMHLGRHLWKRKITNFLKGFSFINNNANDKIIRAFAKLCKKNSSSNLLLVLFEYGPQVQLTKNLIVSLGIEKNICWLPITPRKIIMELISNVDLGIGDIAVGGWGGKALEFISKGTPIINSVSKENKERFEKNVGVQIPPFIVLNDVDKLSDIFEYYFCNRNKLKEIGEASKNWYYKNSGENLANQLLRFCQKITIEKTNVKSST